MAEKKTSKYIRIYGSTLPDLAKKYNVSAYYLLTLHFKGELNAFIEEQEKVEALK